MEEREKEEKKMAGLAEEEQRFRDAFALVSPQIAEVERRIREQAQRFDPGVGGYAEYVCGAGGKRLRPVLALLSAGATGKISDGHLDLAVILELIHVASLVHDDIMDGADVRRDQATANAKWGNAITVLLGDALFAHALRLATSFENTEICRRIADASVDVCSGEILQTRRRFDLSLAVQEYYKIIEMKTAALFAAACELGAVLNGCDAEVARGLESFGRKLGMAYQIYDDCVDLVGSEDVAGKTLGTDLRKGKFTLPVLVLLGQGDAGVSEKIRQVLLGGGDAPETGEEDLVGLLRASGALGRSVADAKKLLAEGDAALAGLAESPFRDALLSISSFVGKLLGDIEK